MKGFILGAIVVAILWIFFSFRSKVKAIQAFDHFDEAKAWFKAQLIEDSSIMFNSYQGSSFAKNSGATVLVGTGKNNEGEETQQNIHAFCG